MKKYLFILSLTSLITYLKPTEQTWVAIGDSITYLNDHQEETGNRVTSGYLSRVVAQLPTIKYINKGYNGWTSGAVAERINNLRIPPADIYTIFLGTNDWWAGRPIGHKSDYVEAKGNISLYGSYRIIIDKLRSINPQAKIILITPMQRADFVYIADPANNAYGSYKAKAGQHLEDFAAAIKEIGRMEKLHVIDLYHDRSLRLSKLIKFKKLRVPGSHDYKNYPLKASFKIPFHPGTDDYPYPPEAMAMTYDGLHPSDEGNAVIAKRIVAVFKSMK
ncbi:lysophospholipase L1-like esterase [Pedobacter psychrotolerans]|uniref:Lysophospholipase L1-like esterase n=1 Tax=Pedobacter psychrotolerans TaxID=1843235 RepID=A0A4R2HIU6_9SPHI|nr:SGNH/GDSL hydrolase family protein [Pedobacter psychrotolerans]TCO28849.1 lysophospholipase L1-like esterase [Pedobacter psychrotolerans]GGE52261.1 hypothetical protein GCM10011413_18200 [Pedobacter psychrotolerans]